MLVILRSISAMGKSTICKVLNPSTVISSDSIREEIYGTFNIPPSKSNAIWKEVQRRLKLRMEHGRFTVVDATSLSLRSVNRLKTVADQCGQETRILTIRPDLDLALIRMHRRRIGVTLGAVMDDDTLNDQYQRYLRETPKIDEVYRSIHDIGNASEIQDRLVYLSTRRNVFVSETDNVFVFGDVHGFLNLAQIAFDHIPAESLIFSTGDLIDRGDDSMGTLRLFMDEPRVAGFTMGNHEKAFLNEMESGNSASEARRRTHAEFKRLSNKAKETITQFLLSGRTHIVVERSNTKEACLLTHAGVGNYDPETITYDQTITDKVNPVSNDKSDYFDFQLHGHMSWEHTGDLSGNVKNIDSGCGHGKALTVYAPFKPELSFQVNPDGTIQTLSS